MFGCQHNEEEIILKYLGHIKHGLYVDIGAGFPRALSNTYFLYERGWEGLCFEPFPDQPIPSDWVGVPQEKWNEVRPNDLLSKVALSDYDGFMDMYFTASEQSDIGKIYKENEHPTEKRTVRCYKLNTVLNFFEWFREADFCSIDVDSYEHKVLAGIDFNIFKPKLICIEYMVRNKDYRDNWEHFLLPYYEAKEVITGNCFYLRKNDNRHVQK